MSDLRQGQLKIYFGYAAGVGKTYQMLEDARGSKARGVDIVVGYLELHGRKDISAASEGLELIPRKQVPHRGGTAEEMDVAAILRRAPEACIVDELAHSNPPGSDHSKRWADVQVLRESGIDVLTTMNVHDLASLSDQIWQITGSRVRETVPDWVFQQADDVIIVDVTPRALLHRLERGAIYSPETLGNQAKTFFQESTLVALRELAIRQAAQSIEARQRRRTRPPESQREQILVQITADPATAMLLRRARRVADYFEAECLAVCVYPESEFARLPDGERQAIERHLRFAENLRIETAVIQSKNRAKGLVEYARQRGVTQIFIGHKRDSKKGFFSWADFTSQVVRQAVDLEVTIIAEQRRTGGVLSAYPEDEAGALMHSSYVALSAEMTVDEAIAWLRRQAAEVEMISYGYVLGDSQRLLGVVSFRDLLSAERSKRVRDMMRRDCLCVSEDADKTIIAQLLAKHRLLAVPVVDSEGQMRGIVDAADIVALAQLEAGKDIQKIGGMEALDGPYLDVTFGQMVRKRAGWLAILFVGEMLTATAMGYFSDEISRAVVLALFLPLIISSGGNSGSQATTLVIRAMAVGELHLRDWWRVIGREISTGLALGCILGVIGISRIILWQMLRGTYGRHYLVIATTIGCSLVGVVLFGTLAGSMLPFILRRCGLDPASASAPFVATLVDVSGLIIYFSLASFILRGTLL